MSTLLPHDIRDIVAGARAVARNLPPPANEDRTLSTAGQPSGKRPALPPVAVPGYRDLRLLSQGGQGAVYRGIQDGTNREVAIKLMRDGAHASVAMIRRFEREIALVGQLSHPNIVPVFHSGYTESGLPFFVMDYVDGRSLRDFIRDTKPGLASVIALFRQICEAVQYAHQRGIIHRDLKPSNILVAGDGTPRILDFGLARQLGHEDDLTISDQIMGTLPYMSPEQARAEHHAVDTRTDVYALGVILYELLTGHYPYPVQGNLMNVLRHISETQPTPPIERWEQETGIRPHPRRSQSTCPIDDDIQTIILRSLAKEPNRRYQGAGELARDLANFLDGRPIEAKRDSFWYVMRKLALRNQLQTAAVVSVLVILGSTATIVFSALQSEQQQRQQRARAGELLRFETADVANRLKAVPLWQFALLLAEWESGRAQAAALARQTLPPQSAESIAADFLLHEKTDDAALLARLPAEDQDIGLLAIAASQAGRGNTKLALTTLQRVIQTSSKPLCVRLAKDRVVALEKGP